MPDIYLASDANALAPSPVRRGLRRVLVVEDVDTTRRRMCSALRTSGYYAVEAENGAEGLRLLSSDGDFDAVLLDLLLPQLDGWRFREAQLNDPRLSSVPTIIVTVKALREPDRYVLRAQRVIQKPFEDDTLIAMVASACEVAAASATVPSARAIDHSASRSEELLWSKRGEVACSAHAPQAGSERWISDRWTPIPKGAGRDRIAYQCQHCSGRGPIDHRSIPLQRHEC